MNVTVWGENQHEHQHAPVREIYPEGMHSAIAAGIADHLEDTVRGRTATLQQPEHGLTVEVIAETDVLLWWGHIAHDSVDDEIVDRVHRAVLAGMGLIVLHSGHFSKIFTRLMGTTCSLDWRSAEDRELIWTAAPGHPIATGVTHPLIIEREEMYGEPFDVPKPDEVIFISSFSGGEVFRSGCTYQRGRGRIFYFRPGDQAYPTYYHDGVRRVIANAVVWTAPLSGRQSPQVSQRPTGWFEAAGGHGTNSQLLA